MTTNDPRTLAVPVASYGERNGNGQHWASDSANLSPPSKRAGKQPMLREPIDSIVSETSFVTNPYAAGGPVGTPSPGPLNAPPGLNPVPIPQPSSFILPPLNFVPLAGGYFTTATAYATSFLPGSHPLRLSVALEHSAFLWDCIHDHEGSRRVARRAIKDVYRAQEAMDDNEFEDAAELVGILGRMMKRKSFESTPRVGGSTSPEAAAPTAPTGAPAVGGQRSEQPRTAPIQEQTTPPSRRRKGEGSPMNYSPSKGHSRDPIRSRSNSGTKPKPVYDDSVKNTPKSNTYQSTRGGSQDNTPRARHISMESGASTTPRAPQGGRSPATPSTVRSASHQYHGSGGSVKGTPVIGNSTPIAASPAAALASNAMRTSSPTLRRSPPLRLSPKQDMVDNRNNNVYRRQPR